MSNQPIMIMELIQKYISNPKIEHAIPELSFLWTIAKEVKKKGCYCGVNNKIFLIAPQFNQIISNLSPNQAQIIAKFFGKEKICFGFINGNRFEQKCY
jgi:hypothetical protein